MFSSQMFNLEQFDITVFILWASKARIIKVELFAGQ